METPVIEAPVKEKKNTGAMIGAIAAIVLCGLTGLCLLCPGGISLAAGWGDTGDSIPNWSGYIALCLSVIFIVIGIVVPIVLLRKKKPAAQGDDATVAEIPQGPLPPAS